MCCKALSNDSKLINGNRLDASFYKKKQTIFSALAVIFLLGAVALAVLAHQYHSISGFSVKTSLMIGFGAGSFLLMIPCLFNAWQARRQASYHSLGLQN